MRKFIFGMISGGLVLRLIDYCIAWRKERREQKTEKTAKEKDRPRFRIDISKGQTAHANVPAVVVKILSLGGLPITINDGEVFIQTGKYPKGTKHQNLLKTQITSSAPIKYEIPLPEKDVNLPGSREQSIQAVVKFSYGTNGEAYEETIPISIAGWY